ncbi:MULTISPECIES: DUF2062 domain-containing protein [unclassified Aureimonas]|uniref:DUF2062 domain-containing protein n=1 Tax=unclassified Aureimonas TaxID=2615206 RepID=UPI0006F8FA82|nr:MULTISPECIES: DUF2062 domain-containing protein [unclassified Aureimonas]KQT55309.1 hypothetical protein ASG62_10830 [Aureimonas sp. Leaf427]KQT71100.1 hypothetical protein ASG54_21215 [Aureimonas sp. Leaf460]
MLFRRREPQTFWTKLRTACWPRRSFRRSATYLKKRVLRLNAKPHAIAAGVAAGVLSSFTPFLGFHFLIAFALAFCLSGNMAAAALGCVVGNPLTFPAIWAATYEVGRLILGVSPAPGDAAAPSGLTHALMNRDLAAIWEPIVKPMLVGSVPLGLGFAAVAYGVVYLASRSFQRRRAIRLQERRAASALPRGPMGSAA